MTIRYLSVCSGIEAATVAWHPLGWEPAAFSEIEAFPRAVLAHHYPDTPCHGDFTTIGAEDYGPIDLLVGGTPCQSFSIAGKRGGMADGRGNLALEYIRLANRKRARWVVWENVPGVFSSNGGEDFRCFLSGLVRWGVPIPDGGWSNAGVIAAGPANGAYGLAWRVLDAQFAGVPQRRRRVFVIGYIGDWRRAAAVLFERHSLSGNPAPRREKGQGFAAATAPSLTASGRGVERTGESRGQDPVVATFDRQSSGEYGTAPVASTVSARDYKGVSDIVTHSLRAEGFDASEDGTGRGTPLVPVAAPETFYDQIYAAKVHERQTGEPWVDKLIAFTAKDHGADASDISPTLRSGSHSGSHANGGVMPAVAFADCFNGQLTGNVAPTMGTRGSSSNSSGPTLMQSSAVRRLTPRECERLQGFPDDYTLAPYRNKPAADGPRYKALGNSMAVPVMRWIGERVAAVEAIVEQALAA